MIATRVGEIREVSLSDGSKLTLDTDTKVEVTIGRAGRTARINRGRARFRIARSRTPFVVDLGGTKISAAQGLVDVEQLGSGSLIDVFAGRAKVRKAGTGHETAMVLGPGDEVAIGPKAAQQKHRAATALDWTRGMLQFDGTPLAEAARQANRYSYRHIHTDPAIDQLQVSGAFRAGDTEGLARSLAEAFKLTLKQMPDGSWTLSPGGEAQRPS